jgi:hypothetical protein
MTRHVHLRQNPDTVKAWKVRSKSLNKVGRRARRNASPDRRWREQVKTEDGMCVRCRRPGDHCHHVYPKQSYPELRHEPRNGCFLCWKCHDWAHAHERQFQAWWAGQSAWFREIYRGEA